MLAWYFARQSLLSRSTFAVIAVAAAAPAVNEPRASGSASFESIARLGVFFLAFAVPYAAISLRYMDLDGRLDQARLGDRPALELCLAACCGFAGPWFVAGLAAIAVSTRALTGGFLLESGALVAVAWGTGLLGLAMASRGGVAPNPIVVAAGSAAVLGFAALVVGRDVEPAGVLVTVADGVGRSDAALLIMGGGLVLLAVCAPVATRRVLSPDRPSSARSGIPRVPDVVTARLEPVMRRGVLLTGWPALTLGGIVLGVPLAVAAIRDAPWNALMLYPFVSIAAIVVSFICRADAMDGRGEIMSIAHGGPGVVAAHVAGLWLPFVAVAAVAVVGGSLAWGYPPALLGVVGVIVAVAPLAAAEGWHRRSPMLYVGGVLLVGLIAVWDVALRPRGVPADGVSAQLAGAMVPIALAGLGFHVALRAFGRPRDVVIRGVQGYVLVAALSSVAWIEADQPGLMLLALVLVAVAGWYRSPGVRMGVVERWAPVVIIAVNVAAAVVSTAGARWWLAGGLWLALAGAVPAAAFWASARVHERFGARGLLSIGLRLGLCVGAVGWLPLGDVVFDVPRPLLQPLMDLGFAAGPRGAFLPVWLRWIAGVMVAATLVLIVELVVRLPPRLRHPTA